MNLVEIDAGVIMWNCRDAVVIRNENREYVSLISRHITGSNDRFVCGRLRDLLALREKKNVNVKKL